MHILLETRHSKENLDIHTALEKAELRDELLELPLDEFKSAVVTYDDDHSHTFKTVKELIDELGKFGV